MITVQDLSLQYGGRVLFSGVNLNFHPGNRYGIVGANGAGKSSFMRILSGQEAPQSGKITQPRDTRVGVLQQDHFQFEEQPILDVVLSGNPPLWDALSVRRRLSSKEGALTEKEVAELTQAEEDFGALGGYEAEAGAARLLAGLGVPDFQLKEPLKILSGGYKLRVLLARTLFGEPDVLLLDEPTNHLDILSIAWLENFLSQEYEGTLLVVSHDRDFLNRSCTHMVDVDYQTMTVYTGNYDQFLKAREMDLERREKEINQLEKKKAEMEAFVERFRAKATKARQAQSRVKQIEKMDIPDIQESFRRYPSFVFKPDKKPGKLICELEDIRKSFGEHDVLKGISLKVYRGDRIALIGPNGAGKTTLLRVINGSLEANSGAREFGPAVRWSTFSQDTLEGMENGKQNLYDWLYNQHPAEETGRIRWALGSVLFTQDDVFKTVGSLSGGEAARLQMARIMLDKPNFLILDEPTNHLDLESVDALENALREFEGTILFVSHDKKFVEDLATRIWAIDHLAYQDYPGGYRDFLDSGHNLVSDTLSRLTGSGRRGKKEKGKSKSGGAGQGDRRELKKEINRLEKTVAGCEDKVEKLESELESINAIFSNPETYMEKDHEEIEQLTARKNEIGASLEKKMREWEESQAKLEQSQKLFAENFGN